MDPPPLFCSENPFLPFKLFSRCRTMFVFLKGFRFLSFPARGVVSPPPGVLRSLLRRIRLFPFTFTFPRVHPCQRGLLPFQKIVATRFTGFGHPFFLWNPPGNRSFLPPDSRCELSCSGFSPWSRDPTPRAFAENPPLALVNLDRALGLLGSEASHPFREGYAYLDFFRTSRL